MEPTELVEELCARIDRIDPLLYAFTPEPGRYLRLAAEARELERRYGDRERPPLYGVPVAVKDVIHVDGLPTHAGSALPPGLLAGPEATVVRRLRAAGALVAGKTVTAEFALNAPGPTRNPVDPAHTPGGSSSGSAAAVAAGLVPLAVGTQTVGSVIRPAAYCGVVGFCPSYGRIPADGLIANAPSLDTVGIFAPDLPWVERAAAVLFDDWRPSAVTERPPVLGVPVDYLEAVSPAGRDAFERLRLTARRMKLPWSPAESAEDMWVISRYELAQVHRELYPRFANLYRPETASAIRHGQEIDPAAYTAALHARSRYRRRLAALTAAEGIDLWATPAATGPAPVGLESTGDAVMSLPWSHAGWPALTLPAGTVDGLPVGLQLVAPAGADEQLLRWAAGILPGGE
ncbi:amidase [Kitasatospora sp. CMC57]|uniref:Amidase n=1 Tax=Kitasatospora sp. CMC57 TaxID=3231513 RepID=A0AB33K4T6_9ACTN